MQVAAFQNGYFVALCNRVGPEECLTFGGESFVTAPDGRVIARAPAGESAVLHAELDRDVVNQSHARRLFLRHRRPELYEAWRVNRESATEARASALGLSRRRGDAFPQLEVE